MCGQHEWAWGSRILTADAPHLISRDGATERFALLALSSSLGIKLAHNLLGKLHDICRFPLRRCRLELRVTEFGAQPHFEPMQVRVLVLNWHEHRTLLETGEHLRRQFQVRTAHHPRQQIQQHF